MLYDVQAKLFKCDWYALKQTDFALAISITVCLTIWWFSTFDHQQTILKFQYCNNEIYFREISDSISKLLVVLIDTRQHRLLRAVYLYGSMMYKTIHVPKHFNRNITIFDFHHHYHISFYILACYSWCTWLMNV